MARYDLGLSNDEWLDMTPRMVAALYKRHDERLYREELLTGIVAATTANTSFCRPEHGHLKPTDFLLRPQPVDDSLAGDRLESLVNSLPPQFWQNYSIH
jgi:hypothetical protein